MEKTGQRRQRARGLTCKAEGCDRPAYGHGLCNLHYRRWRRHGDPLAGRAPRRPSSVRVPCSVDGCETLDYRKGLCRRHHYRLVTYGDPLAGGPLRSTDHTTACHLPGCTRRYLAKGLCAMHYQRRREHGDPLYQAAWSKDQPCIVRGCSDPQLARGYCAKHYQRHAKHGDPETLLVAEAGKGGVSSGGYRIMFRPGHPNAGKHGRIPEHRLIMSEILGRPLLPEENVHHRNGDKLDNRPENLELWVKSQPCGQRSQDLVAWARQIIDRYGGLADALERHAADRGVGGPGGDGYRDVG